MPAPTSLESSTRLPLILWFSNSLCLSALFVREHAGNRQEQWFPKGWGEQCGLHAVHVRDVGALVPAQDTSLVCKSCTETRLTKDIGKKGCKMQILTHL